MSAPRVPTKAAIEKAKKIITCLAVGKTVSSGLKKYGLREEAFYAAVRDDPELRKLYNAGFDMRAMICFEKAFALIIEKLGDIGLTKVQRSAYNKQIHALQRLAGTMDRRRYGDKTETNININTKVDYASILDRARPVKTENARATKH